MATQSPGLKPNRLAREKSPYLLQHAHNPVDWYPWGREAFERARAEGRPIFLSIGYSTCHWCHVMERESFEDPTLADLLNRDFVSVKVDREERPDVDRIYMAFVQAATGSGGWPLSVFLTPDLEPFYGGTYFPPADAHGRPGFATVLTEIAQAWRQGRGEVSAAARTVTERLRAALAQAAVAEQPDRDTLRRGYQAFAAAFDPAHGGFGRAPKFPRPSVHTFLLRHFVRTGTTRAAEMVIETLGQMARGGIRDVLGGGFHRYSVDRAWHVPHFEKMLYDQAQLVRSYVEAYQVTGGAHHLAVARETADYVLADLTDARTGAFLSAEDADSPVATDRDERAEGAFYVWTRQDLDALLPATAAEVFAVHYDVRPEGNADDPHGELTGKNVLHQVGDLACTAARTGRAVVEIERLLDEARARLRAARDRRPRPHRDDKVLCDWNGVMISALARLAQVVEEPRYLDAARRAARFVVDHLFDGAAGTLRHRFRDGEPAIEGMLADYANLVEGLLDLYEASFELDWLTLAERLTEKQIELFHDPVDGGFFTSASSDPSLILRMKDDHDGAEPSGNSVATMNLLRLAEMVGRSAWAELARRTLGAYSQQLADAPDTLPAMLAALDLALEPPAQVVLAPGRNGTGLADLLRAVRAPFAPHKVVLCADTELRRALGARLPTVAAMMPLDGRATAYVCRNQACERPTADPDEVIALLPVGRLPS